MSSSKVPEKLTDTATPTEQVPSILNNNYVKIGGALVIFVLILIILYNYFTPSSPSPSPSPSWSSPSSISQLIQTQNFKHNSSPLQNDCQLFSDCNFKNMSKEDKIKYVTSGNSINEINDNIKNITEQVKLGDIYIKSIKCNSVILTLFSNPDFTGEVMKLKNSIDCLEKPMKSIIIEPVITIGSNTF
jgi:hypothetical protein